MPYLHAGTTREHSTKVAPANPNHWCTDCRCWFYRHTTADCKVCNGIGVVNKRIAHDIVDEVPCPACGGDEGPEPEVESQNSKHCDAGYMNDMRFGECDGPDY